ncbi:GNAT family N-acetyltransferase [Gordonia sp. DT30]|uniref:GNAT family N-acetyltransferase n=1 Tax=unclassified Gordonia (in: high G+C Gram-positive bacteria) TaxID=2657482 RepID=UPI003CF306C1
MTSSTPHTFRLHHSRAADLDAATLYRILRLRVDVFVVEQACPYPELDGRDLEASTQHFWCVADDVADGNEVGEAAPVAATLRLMQEAADVDGRPEFRIGRVCTERSHRGQGLAAGLLSAALERIGDHVCRIEAQTYLTQLYAAFGFRTESEEYLEDGIPHVSMIRSAGQRAR